MASYSLKLNTTRIKKEGPNDIFYDANSPNAVPFGSAQMTPDVKNQHIHTPPTSTPIISGSVEQALLKPTIYEKCQALTSIFSNSPNIHSLQHHFPILIQKIFGFGQYPPGWMIETTHKLRSRRDSDAVLALLHPKGPLFTHVIYKLMAEQAVFEFPYSFTPEATKKKIEEGLPLPELYNEKFKLSAQSQQPLLLLDAFEYYFFIFAYKMVSSSTKTQELYMEPSDWLYPTLLDDYLQFFFPKTGIPEAAPNLPITIKHPQSHNTPRATTPHGRRLGLGLLKQTPTQFSRSLSTQQTSGDGSVDGEVMWRSERIVQILAELWMGQTCLDLPTQASFRLNTSPGFPSASPSTSGELSGASLIDMLYPPGDSLPSHDLIMLVRMVIKHLHSFVNTCEGSVLPSHQQNPHTVLGATKRNLLPRYVQKPLYGFLKHAIEKWPLDTSFRPILETWLTFIQPWRYTSPSTLNESKTLPSSTEEDSTKMADFIRLWEGFVKPNSLFYSVLLQDVLSRFVRIDLASSKMSYQLYRVCKVFDIADLIAILREIDVNFISCTYYFPDPHSTGYGDVTAGMAGPADILVSSQVSALESPTFGYRPLFSEAVYKQVHVLLQEMVNAQQRVRKQRKALESKPSSSHDSSILSFIGLGKIAEFNDAQISSDNKDYLNTDRWLEQSMDQLSTIFKLSIPEGDVSISTDTVTDTTSDDLPDHFVRGDGQVELTALGRYQVINGLKKFTNIAYKCDPELQPVRSYESGFCVIQLYKLSCAVNRKYGEWFDEHYNSDGLIGYVARRLLSKHSNSVGSDTNLPKHPRLSLRFLANYYVLGYAVLGYLILSSLIGRLPTIVVATLLFMFYVLIMASFDMLKGVQR